MLAGILAFGIDYSTSVIVTYKLQWTSQIYLGCEKCFWQPILFLVALNCGLVTGKTKKKNEKGKRRKRSEKKREKKTKKKKKSKEGKKENQKKKK